MPFFTRQLPDEKLPREIHFKADKGEIDVFLCPDDANQPTGDPLLDDIRPYVTPIVEKYLSPNNGDGKCPNPYRNCICLELMSTLLCPYICQTDAPQAYPAYRTAQRNLNKILLGAAASNDASDEFGLVENRAKTIETPTKSMLELDNLIDKIYPMEGSTSASVAAMATPTTTTDTAMTTMATAPETAALAKKPTTTNCYQPSQQYQSAATNTLQSQTNIRQSQSHTMPAADSSSHSSSAVDVVQSSLNGTNTMPVTTSKQTKGVRNALISEMVDFGSLNSMISTQQDNANGEYTIAVCIVDQFIHLFILRFTIGKHLFTFASSTTFTYTHFTT